MAKANIVECPGANELITSEQPTIARVFWSDYSFSLSSKPGNEYYNGCGVQ